MPKGAQDPLETPRPGSGLESISSETPRPSARLESISSETPRPGGGLESISSETPPSPSRSRAVRHSSRIELSESALRKNYAFIRERIGPDAIISSVVKANAYGHGIDPFVRMAEKQGIRHFSVASGYEASLVLDALSTDSTILIMGILYSEDLPWVIEHGIEFCVFDLTRLEEASAIAAEVGTPARIHLEVETGGNRLGLPEAEVVSATVILKQQRSHLRFVGLSTHFAGIESLANQFRIQRQIGRFEEITHRVRASRCVPEIRHAACSAAALGFPDTILDLVRVGTAQYGMWPSPDIEALVRSEIGGRPGLHRVLSWKTDVMHLKSVREDDFVGYGTSFQAARAMKIAVLPVGYGTGLPRSLSNRGQVLLRGRKAPIIGLVNMNACMVDVTHVPDVQIGDEAVLVGKQKNSTISIRSFSEFTNALNNEFVVRLPTEIPRMVVR